MRRIVSLATERPFYRALYGMTADQKPLDIASPDQWNALSFVTKDTLMSMPITQRVFIPFGRVDHIRTSSGTSGKGPIFCPRTPLRHMEYRRKYHDFKRSILAYTVPAMPHWHETFMDEGGARGRSVSFDPKEPAASARLARLAGVDALSLFAFHIPLVGPHLVRENIATDIRFIEIAGEACTRALFEYMRETFPNAVIVPFYGSSEVEDSPIGMPCRPITGEEPLALYCAKPSQYHEIIDASGAPIDPVAGAEGELVVTAYSGEGASFPLIRFRTGDTVRVEGACAEHGGWRFTILGRTDMDFLKIQGGVLRADEIARVLKSFSAEVTDRFELRCIEVVTDRGPLLAPTLFIEPKGELDLIDFARRAAGMIRVAPDFTYAAGAYAGRYLPLACALLKPTSGKTRRIVRA